MKHRLYAEIKFVDIDGEIKTGTMKEMVTDFYDDEKELIKKELPLLQRRVIDWHLENKADLHGAKIFIESENKEGKATMICSRLKNGTLNWSESEVNWILKM